MGDNGVLVRLSRDDLAWLRAASDPEGAPTAMERAAAWLEADNPEVFELEQAVAGGLREWDQQGPTGMLARILVLDQFTRNAWRGTPASFSGDALALAAARQLVDSGADQALPPVQRWFAYLPFEHAEDAGMQERSVALFGALARENEGFEGVLDYAHRHRGVIARFGRFPHRNAILGRTSTPQELEFLRQPGSSF